MNDLKERLEEHARWLEEAGESKVRAHVSPDTCKRAAEDIREAVKGIDEQDKQGRNMKLIDVTKLNEKWQTLIGADPAELYLFDEDKPTKIEYIPPRRTPFDIVDCNGKTFTKWWSEHAGNVERLSADKARLKYPRATKWHNTKD